MNLSDGKVLWKANLGNSVQSAPVVTEDVVYLAGMEGEIYALE
jgi:outer membrane protein assembly factor BamB